MGGARPVDCVRSTCCLVPALYMDMHGHMHSRSYSFPHKLRQSRGVGERCGVSESAKYSVYRGRSRPVPPLLCRIAARSTPMLSPLAAYTVLWGISSPLEALKGCFIPCESWGVVVLLLATFATMFPDKLSIGTLAFSARILKWLTRIPFT